MDNTRCVRPVAPADAHPQVPWGCGGCGPGAMHSQPVCLEYGSVPRDRGEGLAGRQKCRMKSEADCRCAGRTPTENAPPSKRVRSHISSHEKSKVFGRFQKIFRERPMGLRRRCVGEHGLCHNRRGACRCGALSRDRRGPAGVRGLCRDRRGACRCARVEPQRGGM